MRVEKARPLWDAEASEHANLRESLVSAKRKWDEATVALDKFEERLFAEHQPKTRHPIRDKWTMQVVSGVVVFY